jgi:hypothetical protein
LKHFYPFFFNPRAFMLYRILFTSLAI